MYISSVICLVHWTMTLAKGDEDSEHNQKSFYSKCDLKGDKSRLISVGECIASIWCSLDLDIFCWEEQEEVDKYVLACGGPSVPHFFL